MKKTLGFFAVMIFTVQVYAFPTTSERFKCVSKEVPKIFEIVEGAKLEVIPESLEAGNRLANVSNYLNVPASIIASPFGMPFVNSQTIYFDAKVNGWPRKGLVYVLIYSSTKNVSVDFDCVFPNRNGDGETGVRIMNWDFEDND